MITTKKKNNRIYPINCQIDIEDSKDIAVLNYSLLIKQLTATTARLITMVLTALQPTDRKSGYQK